MATIITPERPDTPEALALIAELDDYLNSLYPPESRNGFSVEKLIADGVAFFVARHDDAPAGCGGIKFHGTEYAEVKRMYVRPSFRGLGLGRRMLDHLTDHARENGIGLLRLETGVHQLAAVHLYEAVGFYRIPPFGDFREDPLCLCYEKRIA
jgi:ribosomal protein S18 acetylase RimI-like enzyme